MELQSQWVGDLLTGTAVLPADDDIRDWISRDQASLAGYVRSERHTMQVDFWRYRRAMLEARRHTPNPSLDRAPDPTTGGPALMVGMRAVLADPSTPVICTPRRPRKLRWAAASPLGWGRADCCGWWTTTRDQICPPRAGWLRLRPELAGVCGSDVAVAHAEVVLRTECLLPSREADPGHEIVAVVEDVGPGGGGRFSPGDRVAIDPVLACYQRGFDPACRSCQEGHPYICERLTSRGEWLYLRQSVSMPPSGAAGASSSSPTSRSCTRSVTSLHAGLSSPSRPPSVCTRRCSGAGGEIAPSSSGRALSVCSSPPPCACSILTWTFSWWRPTRSGQPRRWQRVPAGRFPPVPRP